MFLICIICVFNVHVLAAAVESADVDIISELTIMKERFLEREKIYENKLAEMEDRLRNAEENSKSLESFFQYKLAEAEKRQNSVEKFFENKIAELEHKLYETAYGQTADTNDNEKLAENIDTLSITEEKLNDNEIARQLVGSGTEPAMKPSKMNSKEIDTEELLTTDHVPKEVPLFHRKTNKGKRLLTPPTRHQVAFSSYVSSTATELGKFHTIPFDHVLLNEGQSFDTTLHAFICPVDGIYMFQSSLLSNKADHIETEIVMDGSVLARMYASGDDRMYHGFDQGFNSATVRCNKGGRVWIRVRYHNGNVVWAEQFSTFSGYLLWEI
ncbi:caprin-2-like [Mercenaria mercenaria]|uniref:caprin-2-like n=1 Tax=Mercenaria mercenaria TaxID=6596 RepID=UPI001E1D8C27|nr:caprin-2-like [Mercenaria mercenaria]